jgi:hypothetical protein
MAFVLAFPGEIIMLLTTNIQWNQETVFVSIVRVEMGSIEWEMEDKKTNPPKAVTSQVQNPVRHAIQSLVE